MSKIFSPYNSDHKLSVDDRATQIRNLAVIGLAATETAYRIKDKERAFVSLFEVIARLADEIEREVNP